MPGHRRWTREFGASKRDSVGRALPDTALRIVDADTGVDVPTGEHGLLEAKITSISDDWIRTTDIASIDEDGFVTLHGRADGAINRGGFKVLPETVRASSDLAPGSTRCLRGGCARRDGSVRCRSPPSKPSPASRRPPRTSSRIWSVRSLPVYNVPVAFAVVDELPRNPALKVSLPAVAALYEAR